MSTFFFLGHRFYLILNFGLALSPPEVLLRGWVAQGGDPGVGFGKVSTQACVT